MNFIALNERDPQWAAMHRENGYLLLAEYEGWVEGFEDTIQITLVRQIDDDRVMCNVRLFDGVDGYAPSDTFVAEVFPSIARQLKADGHPEVQILTSRNATWIEQGGEPFYRASVYERKTLS